MTSTTGRNDRGTRTVAFTLIELLLVLVVISAVLAIAAPTLRGFFRSRQTADTAATMLSLANWARSQAAAEGRTWRLNCDAASGEFWLTAQEGGAFVLVNSSLGRRFRVPEGASLALEVHADPAAPAPSCVQFYPSGRTDVASVSIAGRQGDVFTVACPSATEPFRVLSPSEAP